MSAAWWSVWVAMAGLLIGGVLLAVKSAYQFGRHSQRLDEAGARIGQIESDQRKATVQAGETSAHLAGLQAEVKGLDRSIHEGIDRLDRLIRDLMTGRSRRRTSEGEP